MALNLRITIPEDSPAAEIIQRVAADDHITPEEAAMRLLTEAASLHEIKTPAEELIGAFSNPEDQAILDEAMKSVREHRLQYDRLRDY